MLRRFSTSLAALFPFLLVGLSACNLTDLAQPQDAWSVMICCWDGDLAVGDTMRFNAVAKEYFIGDSPGINSSTTPERYSWTSSEPRVATVDQQGLVHATGLGSTVITATLHGAHAGRPGSGGVMVVPRIAKLLLGLSADTIDAGDTVQVRIAALDSLGAPVPNAVIIPFSSQGLTVVGAESAFLDYSGDRFWTAPARVTYRASAPGEYEIGVARPYMHPGMSYSDVERRLVVR